MQDVINLLPLIKTGQIPKAEAEVMLNNIRQAIKNDPSKGRELGPYISLINDAIKSQPLLTGINWIPVNKGFLAIGHKPGGKISFDGLKRDGATAILTLLHENEGAVQIGTQTRQAGMEWIWFPFSAGNPYSGGGYQRLSYYLSNCWPRLSRVVKYIFIARRVFTVQV